LVFLVGHFPYKCHLRGATPRSFLRAELSTSVLLAWRLL